MKNPALYFRISFEMRTNNLNWFNCIYGGINQNDEQKNTVERQEVYDQSSRITEVVSDRDDKQNFKIF